MAYTDYEIVPWDAITQTSKGNQPVTALEILTELPLGTGGVPLTTIERYLRQAIARIDGPTGIGIAFSPGASYMASLGTDWLRLMVRDGIQWPFSPITANVTYLDKDGEANTLATEVLNDMYICVTDDYPGDIDARFSPVCVTATVPSNHAPPTELVDAVYDMVSQRLELGLPITNPSVEIQAVLDKYRRGVFLA